MIAYEPGASWDEAFTPDGTPRPPYQALMAGLDPLDLDAAGSTVAAALEEEGVTFGGGDARRAFHVDPVPRVIDSAEWAEATAGLAQRARALAAFVADVYGERRIVEAGVVPERVIEAAEYHEPDAVGVEVHAAGFFAGLDLVRGDDGDLRVLEDNARTPSGIAYATGARRAVDRALADLAPPERLDADGVFGLIAAALRRCAPGDVTDPFVVMVSDGPSNSAWHEHRELAERAGLPLVTPGDLSVRGRRLHAAIDDASPRPVDVIYRRTDEDRLRDQDGRPTWLHDLLLEPARAGTLAVANPLGSGVADDKLVHAYVEEIVRFFLDEEPLLRSVHTYDLEADDARSEVLERLGELVIKPRDGYGGEGVVLGPLAGAEELREAERMVRERPGSFVAQEMVALSTHPTVIEGRLEPRHVDLRPFVIGGDHDSAVAPAALTRVAMRAGEMVVNSSREGGGKDTWVMG